MPDQKGPGPKTRVIEKKILCLQTLFWVVLLYTCYKLVHMDSKFEDVGNKHNPLKQIRGDYGN